MGWLTHMMVFPLSLGAFKIRIGGIVEAPMDKLKYLWGKLMGISKRQIKWETVLLGKIGPRGIFLFPLNGFLLSRQCRMETIKGCKIIQHCHQVALNSQRYFLSIYFLSKKFPIFFHFRSISSIPLKWWSNAFPTCRADIQIVRLACRPTINSQPASQHR